MYTRLLEKSIEKAFFGGRVIILYGARRVGKTTLIRLLLAKQNAVPSVFYDATDPATRTLFSGASLGDLKRLVGNAKIITLDEAQLIPDIGTTLKLFADHFPNVQTIATGSSSFEPSNHVNEPLTGRKTVFMLYPLSVAERTRGLNYSEITTLLPHMLRYGLYPTAHTQDTLETIENNLRELTQSYLFKDILTLEKIKSSEILMRLLQSIALQIGSEVSYSELAARVGIDQATVQRYIDLFEKSFILFRIPALSRNMRNEIVRSRKIYFYDLGVRNALINNFNAPDLRTDRGALWENFLIVERLKHMEYAGTWVNRYFWRTYQQQEIDYLEEAGGKIEAFDFNRGEEKARPPKKFLEAYPNSTFSVIHTKNWLDFVGA